MSALLPYYAALAVAIVVGTVGQILLKAGSARTSDVIGQFIDPFTILGLGAYGIGAFFYVAAVKKIPISLAFPSVSISYILVALAAHYGWGEPLGLPQIGGILLIGGGILLLHQV